MRITILLFTLLTFFLQVKSQDSETEIYLMQNNSIVKGKLLESSNDSVRIMVDSVTTITFAKSELEGKELPVSKEVNKFRKRLMRNESNEIRNSYPGIYQIRNGENNKSPFNNSNRPAGLLNSSGRAWTQKNICQKNNQHRQNPPTNLPRNKGRQKINRQRIRETQHFFCR